MTQLSGSSSPMQMQVTVQWITSLAISIICCAVLFVVFAGYLVELHDQTNLLTVKVELLKERHTLLQSELLNIKRMPVVQINSMPTPHVQMAPAPAIETNAPVPQGEIMAQPLQGEPKDQGIIVQDTATGEGIELAPDNANPSNAVAPVPTK